MSDPHAHPPAHAHRHDDHGASPAAPFTAADWQAFRQDDVVAGRAVVVLMTAIFSIGVVLYSIVLSAVVF